MGRRQAAPVGDGPAEGGAVRRPGPLPPALVDGRVLVVAALVASPAAYRATQGLLSLTEAMTRYLLIALGCVLVSVVVRALWPVVAGPDRAGAGAAGAGAPGASSTPGGHADAGATGVVLDDGADAPFDSLGSLGDLDSFGSFDELDALELSTD